MFNWFKKKPVKEPMPEDWSIKISIDKEMKTKVEFCVPEETEELQAKGLAFLLELLSGPTGKDFLLNTFIAYIKQDNLENFGDKTISEWDILHKASKALLSEKKKAAKKTGPMIKPTDLFKGE